MLSDKALQDVFFNPQQAVDPVLAAVFVQQIGSYPPGALVRLQNGEIGVVSKRTENNQAPQVHALVNPSGAPLLPHPPIRTTDDPEFHIQAVLHEDDAAIRFSMKQIWGAQASL